MAEQLLDGHEVGTFGQHIGCERMPQHVCPPAGQVGQVGQILVGHGIDPIGLERISIDVGQEVLGRESDLGIASVAILDDEGFEFGAERDKAFLVPLAPDLELMALDIDVPVLEAGHFGAAHPGGIDQVDEQMVADAFEILSVFDVVDQVVHLILGDPDGQDLGHLGGGQQRQGVGGNQSLPSQVAIEATQTTYPALDARRRLMVPAHFGHPPTDNVQVGLKRVERPGFASHKFLEALQVGCIRLGRAVGIVPLVADII